MSTPPLVITSKTHTPGAPLAVVGPATILAAAFEAGTPVELGGKMTGETVYLGYTHQVTGDHGITLETVGADRDPWDHNGLTVGAYLVDMTRLDGAPRLAATHRRAEATRTERLIAQQRRIDADDARLDNLAEDGA